MLLMLVVIGLSSLYWLYSPSRKGVEPIPKGHQAAYESQLQYYSKILKPPMTRNKVEDYLDSKGIRFTKNYCCMDEQSTAILIELGKEKSPWYCSEYTVYLVFHFSAPYPRQPMSKEGGQDLLKEITLNKELSGCL